MYLGRHANPNDVFTVSSDYSKYAVGATLEQNGHPVGFLSHRQSDSESN